MNENLKDQLKAMFQKWSGNTPVTMEELPASGSDRSYSRMSDGKSSALGAYNPDKRENTAFSVFTRQFRAANIRVPEIYQQDEKEGLFLIQDLGDVTLLDELIRRKEAGGTERDIFPLYQKALEALVDLQVDGAKGMDWGVCTPVPAFDRQGMMWDLNYFKYCFLRPSKVPFEEHLLESDFHALADLLTSVKSDYFLHRDYQARNLMVHEGEIWIIDYQGGRRGALQYDVASLLFQARAQLSPGMRADLLAHYLSYAAGKADIVNETWVKAYRGFVLVRALQTLGAYGYRGFFERKPHFIESVPPALDNLVWLLDNFWPDVLMPHLKDVLRRLTETKELRENRDKSKAQNLTVRVTSFSYKKGLPADPTDNGGGFVFDCRALENPGRHEEYKQLTGKDKSVQQFLLKHSRVEEFLQDTFRMVEPSVTRYLERGFTDLMVSFGCTGGQHRSVYCAERMAAHLSKKFGVTVVLTHREQS